MADVKVLARKHYSGADADKADVTGVIGDTYAGNDSGKFYYWNDALSAWKTGLGYEYVERRAPASDKQVGDFTTDGTWKVNGLNLSGPLPVGTKAAIIRLLAKDDAAGSEFEIRPNGVDVNNMHGLFTQVANISVEKDFIIPVDPDRLFDYYGTNLVFITIDVTVVGYFI